MSGLAWIPGAVGSGRERDRETGRAPGWGRAAARPARGQAAPASDRVGAAVRTNGRLEQAQASSFGARSATCRPLPLQGADGPTVYPSGAIDTEPIGCRTGRPRSVERVFEIRAAWSEFCCAAFARRIVGVGDQGLHERTFERSSYSSVEISPRANRASRIRFPSGSSRSSLRPNVAGRCEGTVNPPWGPCEASGSQPRGRATFPRGRRANLPLSPSPRAIRHGLQTAIATVSEGNANFFGKST